MGESMAKKAFFVQDQTSRHKRGDGKSRETKRWSTKIWIWPRRQSSSHIDHLLAPAKPIWKLSG